LQCRSIGLFLFREEKHLLDRLNRILPWYDKYLKEASPAAK
jgi:hypothetical protein